MIFHYAGKYDGDETHLPHGEHHPDAHPFREPESTQKLSLIANIGCVLVIALMAVPLGILGHSHILHGAVWMAAGGACSLLVLLPHELLHAICFKKDVYLYNDLAHGLLFVVGPEDMSRARFILMCLCPNIVFGLCPYIAFLLCPKLLGLGVFGAICAGMGFGDYINVFNALRQMPRHARTYLYGLHSYWYEA